MTQTVQLPESSFEAPDKERIRRRRAFCRRCFFGFVLFLIVSFTTLSILVGSVPKAFRLIGLSAGFIKNTVCQDPPFAGKKLVNILLIGADVNFDGTGEARTDTIKLITVDLAKERVSMLSIPRDTWVTLPNGEHGRINSAYQLGGKNESVRVSMAKTAICSLLNDISGEQIHIDNYIRVQTGGFVKIVDALGGIDINVEKKMDYEDPSQELYIHLKPGLQHLNGTEAMGYVRFRHDAEGDYGRIRRQDQFIRTLVAQMRNPDKKKKLATLGPLMDMVITDLDVNDALAVKRLVEKVGLDGIQTATIPTVPTKKGRADVVEVQDREAAAQIIAEMQHGQRPTVAVINGTHTSGLARDVKDLVSASQYNVVSVGTTKQPVTTTMVIAGENLKSEAEALATQLGIEAEVDTKNAPPASDLPDATAAPRPQITIVLGKDYQHQTAGSEATATP